MREVSGVLREDRQENALVLALDGLRQTQRQRGSEVERWGEGGSGKGGSEAKRQQGRERSGAGRWYLIDEEA